MKRLTFFVLLSISLCVHADSYFGTIVLTDGMTLLPNIAIPTPAEVNAVSIVANAAKNSALSLSSELGQMRNAIDKLTYRVSALNGQVIVYGTCIGFGSQAVESPTNVAAMVIGMTFPSNTVSTTYVNLYVHYSSPMATVGIEDASSLSGAWGTSTILENVLTTFPVAGVPVECYRMLVGVPTAAEGAFFRATGDVEVSVVGQFSVFESLTVNGG